VYGLQIQLFLNQIPKYCTSETVYEALDFILKLLSAFSKQLACSPQTRAKNLDNVGMNATRSGADPASKVKGGGFSNI